MADSFSNLGVNEVGGADTNSPNINEAGQNTVKAISDASQALAIARRLETDDKKRDTRRARVQGAFNGNAPYSEEELAANGQNWAFNVSFGYLEGLIGRALAPYMSFGSNVNKLADIEGKLAEAKMDIIREEFVDTMEEWGKWIKIYSRMLIELLNNGWCVFMWPTDYDPFPTVALQKDFLVPEGSQNDPDDLDLACWRKNYLIHELYDCIKDPEAAKKAGWNVDNVRAALMSAKPKTVGNEDGVSNWEALEKAVRNGALYCSVLGQKEIKTFHVFAPELDGKVTHWIALNMNASAGKGSSGVELFKREARFNSMRDFMVYFDIEPGDGDWHGSRGVGARGFNTHVAIDRVQNEGLNQVFLGGLAGIQVKDDAKQEDAQLMVFGRFFSVPPGMEMIDTKLPSISSEFFQAVAMLENTGQMRTGDVVPDSKAMTGGDKTATQAAIDANRSNLIGESNMLRFVGPFGQAMSIIVKRLCNPDSNNKFAKKFQANVLARGVSVEDLAKVTKAKAFGTISEALGKMDAGIATAFGEFRNDPQVDQVTLKRKRLQTLVGDNAADELLIAPEDSTLTVEAVRQQMEEDSAMMNGQDIPVSPRDLHKFHIMTAIKFLSEQILAHKQGGGAPFDAMDRVGKHAGAHLDFIKQDPTMKQEAQQFEQALTQIGQAVDQLEQVEQAANTVKATQAKELMAHIQSGGQGPSPAELPPSPQVQQAQMAHAQLADLQAQM